MKKLLVAVSAVSTLTILSTTASADMSNWLSKKPSETYQKTAQVESTPQIQKDQPIQTAPQAQPAVGAVDHQHHQNHNKPETNHSVPVTPPQNATPRQPNQLGGQQPNNKVAQEVVNQERVAKALQNNMPKALNIVNTAPYSNEQKNYGFTYIGAMSQILSSPNDINVSMTEQAYNKAVGCASRSGAGGMINQLQSALLSDQLLVENFKIAMARGKFAAPGQMMPGITC